MICWPAFGPSDGERSAIPLAKEKSGACLRVRTASSVRKLLVLGFGLVVVLVGAAAERAISSGANIVPSLALGNRGTWAKPRVAATQTITVTTSSDIIDGDCSSIGGLNANPGSDGEISLREGITAANNTAGEKEIRFASGLMGADIVVGSATGQPLPVLAGGDLTINGDIDGTGAPDIFVDGSLGEPDTPLAHGLTIWSDNNIITGLGIKGFTSAIELVPPSSWTGPAITLSGNRILSNTLQGGGIGLGPLGWQSPEIPAPISNITWQETVICGNRLTGGQIFLYAGAGVSQNNRILTTTITSNRVISAPGGIGILAADTNTAYHGGGSEIGYADDNLVRHVVISGNVILDVEYRGIQLTCANMGNRNNQIRDVTIISNTIVGPHLGIMVDTAGEGHGSERVMSDNHIVNVDIRENRVEDNWFGISVGAGGMLMVGEDSPGISGNTLRELTIVGNEVISSRWGGIVGWAGMINASSVITDNLASQVMISGNQVLTQTEWGGGGIYFLGGWTRMDATGSVMSNTVEDLRIEGNEVSGYEYGVRVIGGSGSNAAYNSIEGGMSGNLLDGNGHQFEVLDNAEGGEDNTVEWDWWRRIYLPLVVRHSGSSANSTFSGRSPSSSIYPGGAFMIRPRWPGCMRSLLVSGVLAIFPPPRAPRPGLSDLPLRWPAVARRARMPGCSRPWWRQEVPLAVPNPLPTRAALCSPC